MPSTDGRYATYGDAITESESASSLTGPSSSKSKTKTYKTEFSWSRYSQRTPGYGGVLRYGLPMNKYSYTCTDIEHWNGFRRVSYPPSGHIYKNVVTQSGIYGSMNDYPTHVADAIVSAMTAEVTNKVLGRLKDQKANHLELASTYKQNVNMIVNAVTRIGQAMNSLRHGDIAGAARRLGVRPRNFSGFNRQFAKDQSKALANGWLELQYGWLPLASDIYETAALIHARHQKRSQLLRASAGSSRSFTTTGMVDFDHSTFTWTNEAKAEVKIILYYSNPQPNLKNLAQLGITNPLLLGWELLPWSFVIDWFLPIGSFISNIDAGLGSTFKKGCITTALVSTLRYQRTASNRNDGGYVYDIDLKAFAKRVAINRQDLGGFPLPGVPQFKDPLSLQHLANATALLVQQKR